MITRSDALKKLQRMVDNQNLVKHCLAVESAMAAYAEYFKITDKQERMKWRIAGLLHDADWEKYPEKHPQIIIEWLKKQDAPQDLINAIEAHGFEFEVEAKTLMAKVLRAVDELTGFIVAVALVKGRKIDNVRVKSVLKKWKEKSFAKGVKREDIERGAKDIGVPLEKHIEIVLSGMEKIKAQLGL